MSFNPYAPKVSVIIAAYNCEDYVSKSLHSVIIQTYSNLEILVCDDGSCDNTFNVILEWAELDSRVVVFQNESNKGIVYTRNFLLSRSIGKFITFLDADDWIAPQKIEKQVKLIKEGFVDAVGVNYIKVDFFGKETINRGGCFKEKLDKTDIHQLPFWPPSIMISRRLYEVTGGFHPFFEHMSCYEDAYWLYEILENGKVAFLNEPLYYYRHNKNSVTRTLNFRRLAGQLLVNELIRQRLSYDTDWLQSGQHIAAEGFIHSYLTNRSWKATCYRQYAAIKTDEHLFAEALRFMMKAFSLGCINILACRTAFYLLRSYLGSLGIKYFRKIDLQLE